MEYLKEVQKVFANMWQYIVENKWSMVFIVFGIIIAYTIGQQASMSKTEHFENRCEKEKRLYEDNKPCEVCEEDKPPKKQEKKTIASASCPKMPDLSQYVLKKDVPDLKNYVHKTLLPDMSKYMLKEYVKDNYVRRTECKVLAEDADCDDEKTIMVVDAAVCPPKTEPKPDCDADLDAQTKSYSEPVVKKMTKAEMEKYQKYLDKNAENMDVTYSKIEDAFLGCNLKSCLINGLPNGLKPVGN